MSDLVSRLLGRTDDGLVVRPRLPSLYEPASRRVGGFGPTGGAIGKSGEIPGLTAAGDIEGLGAAPAAPSPLGRPGAVTPPAHAALKPSTGRAGHDQLADPAGTATARSAARPHLAPTRSSAGPHPAPAPDWRRRLAMSHPGLPAEAALATPPVPVPLAEPRSAGSAGPGTASAAPSAPTPLSVPAPIGGAAEWGRGHPVQPWPARHAVSDADGSPVSEPSAVLPPPHLAGRTADGAGARLPGPADADQQVVRVTIGRIEVRADRPPAHERRPPRSKPLLNLDDYLRTRSHGGPR